MYAFSKMCLKASVELLLSMSHSIFQGAEKPLNVSFLHHDIVDWRVWRGSDRVYLIPSSNERRETTPPSRPNGRACLIYLIKN